ncbi:MAG: HD domain-containing protein [Bdellovibrionales bacterium]|nr:HD domain-containing protein [Bdellovibrionales bacterium]
MGENVSFDILLIGFDPVLLKILSEHLNPLKYKHLSTSQEVEQFLEDYQMAPGSSIFVSNSLTGMNQLEIGQSLSSYYPGTLLIFMTMDQTKFEVHKLKKNGFSECLLWPLDQQLTLECVENIKSKKNSAGVRKFKAVKLVDIQSGQNLPFEVRTFLPINRKYALLTGNGTISDKKIEMLKQKSINSVFIATEELEKFYEYTADQLIQMGQATNDSVSQTEKSERLQTSVRHLFKSILDSSNQDNNFEGGRDLLEQSKKVVESFVEKKTGLNLQEKLNNFIGEGKDSYSHAQIVSSIACLMSMATGIGQPEDLAIAGLFHDIGIQGISQDITIFELDQLNEIEKKQYMQHPRLSLNLLKEKKITLTPIIAEIIEKHHERSDGKGFPSQLPKHKIPLEAQLLSYADAFEYLTRPKLGQKQILAHEAHDIIANKLGLSVELLIKISSFIKREAA